jgi:hypothetical protein
LHRLFSQNNVRNIDEGIFDVNLLNYKGEISNKSLIFAIEQGGEMIQYNSV